MAYERDLLYEDEIRSVEGARAEKGRLAKEPCISRPQTQRPLHPAALVLGWLFKCERTQISRSFVLLKQVRWWEEPAPQGF